MEVARIPSPRFGITRCSAHGKPARGSPCQFRSTLEVLSFNPATPVRLSVAPREASHETLFIAFRATVFATGFILLWASERFCRVWLLMIANCPELVSSLLDPFREAGDPARPCERRSGRRFLGVGGCRARIQAHPFFSISGPPDVAGGPI